MTYAHSLSRLVVSCVFSSIALLWSHDAHAKDLKQGRAVAVYAPPPQLSDVARTKRLAGSGLFLSQVRPDGSVSRVDVLRSTGHAELDSCVIAAFSKWRFKPGTVAEVRTPVNFTGN